MDERRLELKVGAFILAAAAGLALLLVLMGEVRLGKGTELRVDFAHTGNVVQGAPVKLGGVEVGRVEDILLLHDRRDAAGRPLPVQMALDVEGRARAALRQDARVTVATVGPLGEPYLELSPGSAGAAPLADGTVLRGVDAPRLDVVAAQLSAFLDAASAALQENPGAVSSLVGSLSRLSGTLDEMLRDNRGDVRTLTADLTAASKDLRRLAQLSREALEPGGKGARALEDAAATAAVLRRELPPLTANANRALGGVANATGGLTPEDGERLRQALASYAAAGEKLEQLAGRVERVMARVEAGEGTLGALQKDPQLYDELKGLITELRKHPWKVLWKD